MMAELSRSASARLFRGTLLAAAGLLASITQASAHPDVAIDDHVTFTFSGSRVTAIEETWIFDAGYSLSFLADYQTEPEGTLSAAGSQLIATRIQPNLAEVRYFTYIGLDGRDLGSLPVRDFVAAVKGKHLTFTFVFDLPTPVDPRQQKLAVEVYDHDYYAAITLVDSEPVRLRNLSGVACEPQIKPDAEHVYFGDIVPQEITLACH